MRGDGTGLDLTPLSLPVVGRQAKTQDVADDLHSATWF